MPALKLKLQDPQQTTQTCRTGHTILVQCRRHKRYHSDCKTCRPIREQSKQISFNFFNSDPTLKQCISCLEFKKVLAFFKHSRNRDGLRNQCKHCFSLVSRKRWDQDKRKGSLLKKYWPHLTSKEAFNKYQRLLVAQDNRCAICGISTEELVRLAGKAKQSKVLAVDHCHSSKRVRGLLCKNCNMGIGSFKDNLKSIAKALNYLERAEWSKLVKADI